MTDCTCNGIKRIVTCELNRGNGPCITAEPATQATPEPPALNSDALAHTIAAALGGATITTNL